MSYFSDILKYFTSITTGTVLVFIAVMYFGGFDLMKLQTLAEIPLMAVITSIITAVIHHNEPPSQKQLFIRIGIHYVLICAIMTAAAMLFGWVERSFTGFITMVITTAAVYVFTYTAAYLSSRKEAEELNSALRRKRNEPHRASSGTDL